MLKSAKVPPAFAALFEKAEAQVEQQFQRMRREPDKGVLRVGEDRYVLVRAEGFYVGWLDSLVETFGEEVARQFIYNSAREIGRSDSKSFAQRFALDAPVDKLAAGPVHFAHAGWAFVDILEDSAPTPDEQYFLHYFHPNTFESEVLASLGRESLACACLFSAGYSSGWCSAAFEIEVHGREIACVARGEPACEFIMSPAHLLDEHERRVRRGALR
ncbi:MAG: XylR N-terminal domain-containing protein [Myxococcales bacterium]|nr:XylR N-terminal domain-containing protein [Myxococcales bacterium]